MRAGQAGAASLGQAVGGGGGGVGAAARAGGGALLAMAAALADDSAALEEASALGAAPLAREPGPQPVSAVAARIALASIHFGK